MWQGIYTGSTHTHREMSHLLKRLLVVVDHGIHHSHVDRRELIGEEGIQIPHMLGPRDPDDILLVDYKGLKEFLTV